VVAAFTPCFGHLCRLCHHGHFGEFRVRVITKSTPTITATATITITATTTATTNTTPAIVVVATTTAAERTLVPLLLL
jgi:hypothetical protein